MFSYSAIKKPAIKVLEDFLKHTGTHTLTGKSIPSYTRTVVGILHAFCAPGRHDASCGGAAPLKSSQCHLWKDIICCTVESSKAVTPPQEPAASPTNPKQRLSKTLPVSKGNTLSYIEPRRAFM